MFIKNNQYQCGDCGEVFDKGWTDDEANEESLALWGHLPIDKRKTICDDCFKKYMADYN